MKNLEKGLKKAATVLAMATPLVLSVPVEANASPLNQLLSESNLTLLSEEETTEEDDVLYLEKLTLTEYEESKCDTGCVDTGGCSCDGSCG